MRRPLSNRREIRAAALAFFGILVLSFASSAQLPKGFKPKDYVNDFAGVLSEPAKAQISALCVEVEQKTGAQIAAVTVKSLDGRSIEDFSIDVATQLGVGPKKSNRGVLILLAVEDRRYRFQVGYGLEPILPDGKTGSFGREAIPSLRERNYDAALLLMTRRVAETIAQDSGVTLTTPANLPPPMRRRGGPGETVDPGVIVGIIILVVIFAILAIRSRATGSRYTRRGGGWWIGPMIGGGWGGGRSGGGWGGGFGGGGGGFGGFGGGGFGGGGASGSW